MKISDLNSLTRKINDIKIKTNIENLYQVFIAALQQNLQNQANNQPLDPSKNNLYKAFTSFDDLYLSFSELSIIKIFHAEFCIGQNAIDYIENILRDKNFDMVGVIQKLNSHKALCTKFYQKTTALAQHLNEFTATEQKIINPNEALLQIFFNDQTNIDTIVDLKEWSNKWFLILRGFAQIFDVRPEDIKIGEAEKSSPLWLDIISGIFVIGAIAKSSGYILENIEKIFQIKKIVVETKNLKLTNKSIQQDLDKEALQIRENASKTIIDQLKTDYTIEGKDGEEENGLKKAVDNLFSFFEAGGHVEFFIPRSDDPEPKEESSDIKEISNQINKVKILQKEIEKIKFIDASNTE